MLKRIVRQKGVLQFNWKARDPLNNLCDARSVEIKLQQKVSLPSAFSQEHKPCLRDEGLLADGSKQSRGVGILLQRIAAQIDFVGWWQRLDGLPVMRHDCTCILEGCSRRLAASGPQRSGAVSTFTFAFCLSVRFQSFAGVPQVSTQSAMHISAQFNSLL